jgi:hypothetical protein
MCRLAYQLSTHNQDYNINVEGKRVIEMQTSIGDSSIFTEVSRSALAFSQSSLELLARNPSPGLSSRSGNSVDSPGPSHAQVGLRCASPGPLPAVFTIKFPAEPLQALFPSVHGDGYTTNTVGVVSQDYKLRRVQQWCAQAPRDKRCTNLTKH